ncbi:MAG: hypothetical protein MZV63_55410 [Marinilabiliales bacterium]|nr:hypothetical protein [Marinilabiliales bacterium]
MAKAQSDRSVEEIHAHAAMAEEDKNSTRPSGDRILRLRVPSAKHR